MERTGKKPLSWGWIIFWFILFWPLGVFFLFQRLNVDKTAILKNSKTVAIISYVLIGMGIQYPIMAFAGNVEIYDITMDAVPAAILMAVLFGGGGIWVNLIAHLLQLKCWDWPPEKIFNNLETWCSADLSKTLKIAD